MVVHRSGNPLRTDPSVAPRPALALVLVVRPHPYPRFLEEIQADNATENGHILKDSRRLCGGAEATHAHLNMPSERKRIWEGCVRVWDVTVGVLRPRGEGGG